MVNIFVAFSEYLNFRKYNGVKEQKADVLGFGLKSYQHRIKIEEYLSLFESKQKGKNT